MSIYVKTSNNLEFDSEHDRCRLIISRTQGKEYAFIQCIDLGFGQEHTLDTGHEKQYWGEYDSTAPEESIKAIMGYGGQWPNLK